MERMCCQGWLPKLQPRKMLAETLHVYYTIRSYCAAAVPVSASVLCGRYSVLEPLLAYQQPPRGDVPSSLHKEMTSMKDKPKTADSAEKGPGTMHN